MDTVVDSWSQPPAAWSLAFAAGDRIPAPCSPWTMGSSAQFCRNCHVAPQKHDPGGQSGCGEAHTLLQMAEDESGDMSHGSAGGVEGGTGWGRWRRKQLWDLLPHSFPDL